MTSDVGLAHGKLWSFQNYILDRKVHWSVLLRLIVLLFKSLLVGCTSSFNSFDKFDIAKEFTLYW